MEPSNDKGRGLLLGMIGGEEKAGFAYGDVEKMEEYELWDGNEYVDGEDYENGDDDSSESTDAIEEIEVEHVEKFLRTFHNGNYDAEFDTLLTSDRSATLPVRHTQASYNKPDNWRERNRIGLEKMKIQLQNCITSAMNNQSLSLNVKHNTNTTWDPQILMEGEEPIVWHETTLDEYWDQIEAEIDRGRQLGRAATDICRIDIENVEMKKERLAALVTIFRSGKATYSSTSLIFDNANLCEEGIISVSELVDAISEMLYLDLSHNQIDSMDSARFLSRTLMSHVRINQLCLCHCDLGSNPEILSVILQSGVNHMDLSNNNIDSLGAAKIAEYLEVDPPIGMISLGYNRLNDDDALLLSHALKRNTNLRRIDLYSNNFTSIGVKALLSCVVDSSSLNAISESNHSVERLFIFLKQRNEISPSDSICGCIDSLLKLDQTQKIIAALQDKDTLLKYLANLPVELIPEVLAFSQWDDNLCPCIKLNIVYSTMRWWNMPTLYSYHHCVKSDTKRKRDD
jgi:hypothetical protein